MLLRLALQNLLKHPLRLVLTGGALAVAIFLLCVLQSLLVSLDAGVRGAKSNRLIVQSAVSLFVSMPEAYEEKLRAVEGVREVAKWQWFGGYYQDPSNFFAQFAVDPDTLFSVYSELELVDGAAEGFLTERTSCLIGTDLARKFGWKVGDTIPLIGTIFPRTDGGVWSFRVAGIYASNSTGVDNNTLFFPFAYLRESLQSGATGGPPGVGVYVLLIEAGADPIRIMAEIDGLYEHGPQRVQTSTEAEFNAQFVSMIGNVPFFVSTIGTGVLIAILLAVVNTMLLAGREQTPDVGVLKALGFTDGAVFVAMLSQALLLCILGAGLGIGLALFSARPIADAMRTMFPNYRVAPQTIVTAALVALGIGLVAGLVPALRARGLSAIDALRREV